MNLTFYLGTSYLDWYVHMRMFILSGNVNSGNDLQLLIGLVLNMANLLQRYLSTIPAVWLMAVLRYCTEIYEHRDAQIYG